MNYDGICLSLKTEKCIMKAESFLLCALSAFLLIPQNVSAMKSGDTHVEGKITSSSAAIRSSMTFREVFDDLVRRCPSDRPFSYDRARERFDLGTIRQKRRNPMRQRNLEREYRLKNGMEVNATKVIDLHGIGPRDKFSIIAAQCPTAWTLNNFFELIDEGKVDNIVVLGNTQPNRLEAYWLPKNNMISVDVKGYCDECQECCALLRSDLIGSANSYEVYKITVGKYDKNGLLRSDKIKEVNLYHYYAWPDHGPPTNIEHFKDFIKLFLNLNRRGEARKLLVHCAAGVGRTGTFIASLMLALIRSTNVFAQICDLRNCRTQMVQNIEQFLVVCETVYDLLNGRCIHFASNDNYTDFFPAIFLR